MTREEFIEKARAKYGDKYTYEKTIYKNIGTKVIVTDKSGDDKLVWPQYFLYKSKEKNEKFNTVDFIKQSKKIFGENTYDYSKTKCEKSTDKVIITCKTHGDFVKSCSAHIHQKQGCPKCNNKYQDTEKFIKRAKLIFPQYDYSKVEYKNNHTKVCIICPEHGEFWQTPNQILKKFGCPECRKTNKLDTKEDFEKKANLKERNIETAGAYINSLTKTRFKCLICGHEWYALPYKITSGRGCPLCGHRGSAGGCYTTEEWIGKAKKIHGDKYDYSKVNYVNCYTPVSIICPEHGEFWQTPIRHLLNNGCLKCGETKLEREVRKYCEENNIKYEYQIRQNYFAWLGPQSLDFYLPEYNIAIECQGIQHFKPVNHFGGVKNYEYTLKCDKEKLDKCLKHGIKLYYFTLEKFKNYKYIDQLYASMDEIINQQCREARYFC